MTKARVIGVRGKNITIAIAESHVRDYNKHDHEFIVTMTGDAAAELWSAISDTDLSEAVTTS